MPDEPLNITVDADKFDRVLSRMLSAKPLPKSEVSARIAEQRGNAKQYAAKMKEKNKAFKSKKLGQ
jgi:hypothetical protein